VDDARALAKELDLLDRHVFFHDWVPYEERQNWLLQSNVGLSLHLHSLESRFAYRTRMLDNIWCALPIVATEGDVLADLVEREQVGIVVKPNDPDAVADALIEALDPDRQRSFRENLSGLVERHTWEVVAHPLVRWCGNPVKVSQHSDDPQERYVHHLEQTYSETAEYARHLEHVIAEKDRAIQSQQITARNLASLAMKRLSRILRRAN
ncbi:MAG: glycosyltransferase, partial [Nitrolancea sp.]